MIGKMSKKNLEYKVGQGTIIYDAKDIPGYRGTVPRNGKERKTDVVVMRKEDYDLFLKGHFMLLFQYHGPMSKELYSLFPDPIVFFPGKKTDNEDDARKLWIDQIIYSNDPSNMMIFVYKSVDEAEIEGEFNPRNGGDKDDEKK